MSDADPIPYKDNWRCQALVRRLEQGPASTLELQEELPLVHVARQIWELRHWYGMVIKTGRLPNNVAVYTLVRRTTIAPPLQPAVQRDTFWD